MKCIKNIWLVFFLEMYLIEGYCKWIFYKLLGKMYFFILSMYFRIKNYVVIGYWLVESV